MNHLYIVIITEQALLSIEEAAFSIPLPGVTYRCIRSHHYARVPLEEETRKIPMKIHCWGSEEKSKLP